jgi:hypothetical protein
MYRKQITLNLSSYLSSSRIVRLLVFAAHLALDLEGLAASRKPIVPCHSHYVLGMFLAIGRDCLFRRRPGVTQVSFPCLKVSESFLFFPFLHCLLAPCLFLLGYAGVSPLRFGLTYLFGQFLRLSKQGFG